MQNSLVVVGGGMAGLSAALVAARSKRVSGVVLLEQAPVFSEVGAGIQLGPNATRILHGWGLSSALQQCAAYPERLRARDALHGTELGVLPLGPRFAERYGAPYACVHRADLHEILLDAVHDAGRVDCRLDQRLTALHVLPQEVRLTTEANAQWQVPAVLGCDGVWSRVREELWNDGGPAFTGHLAYRGMVYMADLPPALRRPEVTVWLGPRLHAVHYPVRGGEWMNVVVIVEGEPPPQDQSWDHEAHAADLRVALGDASPELLDMLQAVLQWRLWPLKVRPPMQGAGEHVRGRVALLGDAAHPMRPYLAQGAAMALEDAWTLGQCLSAEAGGGAPDWPRLLQHWANQRWPRNAWVQARSRRNGRIFHAEGPMRWARDMALAVLGERLMDVPSLYSGPPGHASS